MDIIDTVSELLPKTNLEKATDASIVTSTGGVTYQDLIMQKIPNANLLRDPNQVNDVEPGKWENLYSRASLQANTDIEGLGLTLYELAVKDPNYIPLRDKQFTSLPAAMQIELAPQVKDAATPEMLAGYIKRAEQAKLIQERTGQYGGLTNFTADVVGSMFNVSNLFIGRATAARLGMFTKAALTGAEVGGTQLLQELGRQKTDPTVQNRDVAINSALGVGLGAGSSMVGALLGSFGAEGISSTGAEAFRKVLVGESSQVPLQTILKEASSASAAKVTSPLSYGLADTNVVFNSLSKALNIGAELDGLRSMSPLVQKLTSQLTGHNYLLKGNLEGVATPKSIFNVSEANFNLMYQKVATELDDAYIMYKADGGKLNQSGFLNEAMEVKLGLKETPAKGVSKAAEAYKKYFDSYNKQMEAIDPEYKGRTAYDIPHVWNREKVVTSLGELKADISEQLMRILRRDENVAAKQGRLKEYKSDTNYVPADREDARFADYVDATYERMALDSAGTHFKQGFRLKTWSNQNLKARMLDFDANFVNKYRSKDVMHIMQSYGKRMSKSWTYQRELGVKDPYELVERVVKDYADMENGIRQRTDLSVEQRNKLLEDLNKSLGKDKDNITKLLDIHTGNFMAGYSRKARDAAALSKAFVYTTTMGAVITSMLPDLSRLAASSIRAIGLDKDIIKLAGTSAETFKAIKDKNVAKLFGVLADPVYGVSRSSMWLDLPELDIMTKVEKSTSMANAIFSKLNLMDPINNFTRTAVAEDVSTRLLAASKKLVDGTLDPSSAEAIDMARMGLDRNSATSFLDQFNRFKEIRGEGKDSVITTGIDSWDVGVASDFVSIVKRAVDNTILAPTVGSKPLWTQTPWGSVLTMLKGFLFASLNKYLLPALQNMSGVNPTIAATTLGTVAADLAISSLVAPLQDVVKGREPNLTPENILNSVLTRNSTFAILGIGNDAAGMFGYGTRDLLGLNDQTRKNVFYDSMEAAKYAGGMFAGPLARQGLEAIDLAVDASHSKEMGLNDKEFLRAMKFVPGNNLLYWSWALQAPQKKH